VFIHRGLCEGEESSSIIELTRSLLAVAVGFTMVSPVMALNTVDRSPRSFCWTRAEQLESNWMLLSIVHRATFGSRDIRSPAMLLDTETRG
jgi:hypothetical protein